MKKTVLLLLLSLCSMHALAQTDTSYALDPKTSLLKWTGHAEVGTYAPSGTLAVQSGQIKIQGGNFAGATVTIDMKSLKQENSDLTHHLKSEDFFDVEHYPTSTVMLTGVANGIVSGTLTIKGKTSPFQSPVKVTQSDGHFAIVGKVQLDRTKYGIVYNSTSFFSGLGNKAIGNLFEVEFTFTGVGTLPAKYRS